MVSSWGRRISMGTNSTFTGLAEAVTQYICSFVTKDKGAGDEGGSEFTR